MAYGTLRVEGALNWLGQFRREQLGLIGLVLVVVLLLQLIFCLFSFLLRVAALRLLWLDLHLLLGLLLFMRSGVEEVAEVASLLVPRLYVGVADDGQLIFLGIRPLRLSAPLFFVAFLPALGPGLHENSLDIAGLGVEVNSAEFVGLDVYFIGLELGLDLAEVASLGLLLAASTIAHSNNDYY